MHFLLPIRKSDAYLPSVCKTFRTLLSSPSHIHFSSEEGMNCKMAQDRGTGVREIAISTSQLISCLVPRHPHSKDPDTVLIRVESMIENTTDSNEF
ncbi:hypothetical protein TNCV_2331131 [Trichonephila clavipes]|nr:hypothetical protein TNCV_2331131 [Trichonephila clavipes]